MGIIALQCTDGQLFWIDEEDLPRIQNYRWHMREGRVFLRERFGKRSFKDYRLHRFLIDAPKGAEVDHIDRNPANNTKENLRLCSHRENLRNMSLHRDSTSGAKGVSFDKSKGRYRAYVVANYRQYWAGYHNTVEEALAARDALALQLHEKFFCSASSEDV